MFGGTAAHTGPTIAGCVVNGMTVTLQFNTTLLKSDVILVQPFDTNQSDWGMADSSAMAVCIGNASQQASCISDATLWVPAAVSQGTTSSVLAIPASSALSGSILAIKYGWPIDAHADTCCPSKTVLDGHEPCIPGSCPIITKDSSLPANPFFALIAANKCRCVRPQVCDA